MDRKPLIEPAADRSIRTIKSRPAPRGPGTERTCVGDHPVTRTVLWILVWMMPHGPAVAGSEVEPAPEQTEPVGPTTQPSEVSGTVLVRVKTSLGDFTLELDADRAPISVANFLRYADEGFYMGTLFHRVIPHFLIQGGGYTTSLLQKTDGLHDPIENEWDNGLKNVRLTIAAARVPGTPDSATSQFYINLVDNPRLDEAQEDGAGYAVFGRVIEGEDVIEKIRSVELRHNSRYEEPGGRVVTPANPVVITTVRRIDVEQEVEGPPSEPPAERDHRE